MTFQVIRGTAFDNALKRLTDLSNGEISVDFLRVVTSFATIAGGAPVYALNDFVPAESVSDIDIFVSRANLRLLLTTIKKFFKDVEYEAAVMGSYSENVLKALKDTELLYTRYINATIPGCKLNLQIIVKKEAATPAVVCSTFDFDYVCCALYDSAVHISEDCLKSHSKRQVLVGYRPPRLYRTEKAPLKGFRCPVIGLPRIDAHTLIPVSRKEITGLRFKTTRGYVEMEKQENRYNMESPSLAVVKVEHDSTGKLQVSYGYDFEVGHITYLPNCCLSQPLFSEYCEDSESSEEDGLYNLSFREFSSGTLTGAHFLTQVAAEIGRSTSGKENLYLPVRISKDISFELPPRVYFVLDRLKAESAVLNTYMHTLAVQIRAIFPKRDYVRMIISKMKSASQKNDDTSKVIKKVFGIKNFHKLTERAQSECILAIVDSLGGFPSAFLYKKTITELVRGTSSVVNIFVPLPSTNIYCQPFVAPEAGGPNMPSRYAGTVWNLPQQVPVPCMYPVSPSTSPPISPPTPKRKHRKH